MRTLIFTGQSQLEQSAAALAGACHAARRGRRVLIASVGPAHLLGGLLGQSLSARPLQLEPNLAAVEIGAIDEMAARWETVRPSLRSGLASRLRDLGSDELPMFPGIEAVASLLILERARLSQQFDLLVLDGPSQAALTNALTLPDVLRWAVRLIFGLDRGVGRSRTSQENAIIPAALIAPNLTAPLQDLRVLLEEQRQSLLPSAGTYVRFVAGASELELPAVEQGLTAIGFFGLATDQLLINTEHSQLDPAVVQRYRPTAGQQRPLLRATRMETTPADRDTWALRGAAIYRDGDVVDSEPQPTASTRELRLHVPFLNAKSLDIAVANEEVVVRLGQLRRHLVLDGISEGGKLRARVEGETLRLWVE
jgi:arsenite/tail-anchored protein-transporting ATPase